MRQIKFRGKSLNTRTWVYGDLQHKGKRAFVEYEVAPETIGQFTEKLDKKGNEVYEGDILGRHSGSGDIVPLSIVLYVNNGFFVQSLVSGAAFHFDLERILERQYVVGNIHDNPELKND